MYAWHIPTHLHAFHARAAFHFALPLPPSFFSSDRVFYKQPFPIHLTRVIFLLYSYISGHLFGETMILCHALAKMHIPRRLSLFALIYSAFLCISMIKKHSIECVWDYIVGVGGHNASRSMRVPSTRFSRAYIPISPPFNSVSVSSNLRFDQL